MVSNWDTLFLNEARGKGIIARPLELYLERKGCKIAILRRKYPFSEREFCTRANSKLGTKYDIEALLDNAIYRTFKKWIGRTKENAESKMVCSEYAAWSHRMLQWWLVAPADILNHEEFIIIYKED